MAFSPILSTLRSGCASRLVARQNFPRTASISRCTSLPRTSTSIAHNILEKTQSRPFSLSSKLRQAATPTESATTPLGNLASSIATKSAQKVKGNAWPETTSKAAGYWLIGSAVSVFGIVVLGGLTRLTESGLSITEWKPVTGALPPMSHADWVENFEKYKDSPEYRIINPSMTLEEFKFIYYMEWAHRVWGRVIGLTFVLPAAYFIARKQVTPRIARRLVGISALIGLQGFIGWWMVKSGLKDDLFVTPGSIPRVSQYRLTTHLGAAFTLYAAMMWTGLEILRDNKLLKDPKSAISLMDSLKNPQLRAFRGLVGLIVAMVFTTAMTGGLVAGLDAGLIYNEFPKMGTGYMPPAKEMFDSFYSHTEDRSDLWWRNMLENPTTVQFQHRVAAISTFTTIMAVWAFSRFNPKVAAALPPNVRKGMMGVVHLALLQVALGISTLIYMVPTHLAATHQAGALALLTGSIVLGHRVWLPKVAARIASQKLAVASVRAAGKKTIV